MSRDRVSVSEAAHRLGIKEESVRKRIKRRSLESERDESGHVWVYMYTPDESPDENRDESPDTYQDLYLQALLDQLRSENAYLREENQRKDSIIMSLSQRVPELEDPHGHTERPESAPNSPEESPSEPRPQHTGGLRARLGRWWRGE